MIELPEARVFAKQIEKTLKGKKIVSALRGQNPHKFMFPMENDQVGFHSNEEFAKIITGKSIEGCDSNGNIILVDIEPGYILSLGCGGENILYHKNRTTVPKKHQLLLEFQNGTFLTVTISGWGEIRLLKSSELLDHPHIGYNRTNPLSDDFSPNKFKEMIDSLPSSKKCSVKKFFVTEPGLRGIGNGVIQDIFFLSNIHPRREINSLSIDEQKKLFTTTIKELNKMIKLGGRDSEKDLFNNFGGYPRIMHNKSVGSPCPRCGTIIEKQQYLGGSIYFCLSCQPMN